MKELNSVEIQNVSGAGVFSDTFSTVAAPLGTILQLVGWNNAKVNATNVAKHAGQVIDSTIATVNSFLDFVFRK